MSSPHASGCLVGRSLADLGGYGDIGTSQLYTMDEIFACLPPVPLTLDNVQGILPLVVAF